MLDKIRLRAYGAKSLNLHSTLLTILILFWQGLFQKIESIIQALSILK